MFCFGLWFTHIGVWSWKYLSVKSHLQACQLGLIHDLYCGTHDKRPPVHGLCIGNLWQKTTNSWSLSSGTCDERPPIHGLYIGEPMMKDHQFTVSDRWNLWWNTTKFMVSVQWNMWWQTTSLWSRHSVTCERPPIRYMDHDSWSLYSGTCAKRPLIHGLYYRSDISALCNVWWKTIDSWSLHSVTWDERPPIHGLCILEPVMKDHRFMASVQCNVMKNYQFTV